MNHENYRLALACGAIAILVTASTPLHAGNVNVDWGSGNFQTMITSTGTTITDLSGFTFEIGSFGATDPTAIGMNYWRFYWTSLDSTAVVQSPNPSTNYIFGDTTTYSTGDSFANLAGSQIYIWGYDQIPIEEPADVEWVLLTRTGSPAWTVQMPDPCVNCQNDLDIDYFLSGADEANYGAIHDPTGPFDLKTGSYTVIPEPSRLSLAAIGFTAALLRRRRPSADAS